MGTDEVRTQGEQKLFEATPVLESLAKQRDQLLGDVHAAATLALGEGEDPGGVLVTTGAGGTVLADARFSDKGQGTFERGPKGRELGKKVPVEQLKSGRLDIHEVCIYYHIHTMQAKKMKKMIFI